MQISGATREMLALAIGGAIGLATAGGALTALTGDSDQTKQLGRLVAGGGAVAASIAGLTALRMPAARQLIGMGALGFVGLPAVLATGLIQQHRDS